MPGSANGTIDGIFGSPEARRAFMEQRRQEAIKAQDAVRAAVRELQTAEMEKDAKPRGSELDFSDTGWEVA